MTDEVLDRIAAINEDAQQRYQRAVSARKELESESVTVESPDGVVRVTVSSAGALRNLELNHLAQNWSPARIAAEVLECVQRAQSRLADTARDVYARHLSEPDDPSVGFAVHALRRAFPVPTPRSDRRGQEGTTR